MFFSKKDKQKDISSMNEFEKKHTPKIQIISNKVIIKVGTGIEHPMNPEHYITDIEMSVNGKKVGRKKLDSEDEPAATFSLDNEINYNDRIIAFSKCNRHGVWESTLIKK